VSAIYLYISLNKRGIVAHTTEFADQTITHDGQQTLIDGALALEQIGYDILTYTELLQAIREEFNQFNQTQSQKNHEERNNMKKILLKGLIAMIIISLLVACGAGESEKALSSGDGEGKQTLKLATSVDFPPFESRDPEGNFEGFDIELAEMIAEELGYELDIEDMSFDGLIGSLQSNRVDMVMAGMSATEERKENVDFSDEYHRSGEMFITKSSEELEDLDDLTGKVVGVQLGTIQEEGAEKLAEQYDFEVKK